MVTDQLTLPGWLPRSCIRNQSQENLLERTKIVLALPSYNRQRLSGIRRGWCPSQFPRKITQGIERVVRSDSGVAHRLSLSARVVSAVDSQVKAKRQGQKRLWRLQNRHFMSTRKARRNNPQRAVPPLIPSFTRVLFESRTACGRSETSIEAKALFAFFGAMIVRFASQTRP